VGTATIKRAAQPGRPFYTELQLISGTGFPACVHWAPHWSAPASDFGMKFLMKWLEADLILY
jgi:hypothetical protein